MTTDKDFFWGMRHTLLEDMANTIEYTVEQAMERDSEDFTTQELEQIRLQAHQVQDAVGEILKRITPPSRPKKVVRFKRRKDGTQRCARCKELVAPGQLPFHMQEEHK